jgi:hypothetical protein
MKQAKFRVAFCRHNWQNVFSVLKPLGAVSFAKLAPRALELTDL